MHTPHNRNFKFAQRPQSKKYKDTKNPVLWVLRENNMAPVMKYLIGRGRSQISTGIE